MRQIILSEDKNILKQIKKHINESEKITIAVSYIVESGLNEFIDLLKGKEVEVITSTSGYVTEPKAIESLSKIKNINLRIIDSQDEGMHAKFIIFKKKNNSIFTIGSSNISFKAFNKNIELNYFDVATKEDLEDFEKALKSLKEFSIDIKNFNLSEYYLRFSKYKKLNNYIKSELIKLEPISPRGMQVVSLEKFKVFKKVNNEGLLIAATGSGKTYLSAFFAKELKAKKILFIVHNRTILKSAQLTYKRIFNNFNSVEIFTRNINDAKDNEIIFATDKTLIKNINNIDLKEFDFIVFDEAHRIGSKNQEELFNILRKESKAFILGMTATPFRSDNHKKVFDLFSNKIINNISLRESIKNNYVTNFEYFTTSVDFNTAVNTISNYELNSLVVSTVSKLEKVKTWDGSKVKGLIFVKTITEANSVAKLMSSKGYYSIAVTSKNFNNENDISKIIDKLQDDDHSLNFLVTVNKFNEGIDIPKLNTIVMMRLTNSSIIYSQQIGRGLRKIEGHSKHLNIIDLVGNDQNNYIRISGLNGEDLSPIELSSEVIEMFHNGVLDYVSSDKILSSIEKKSSHRGSFISNLTKQYSITSKEISLLNINETIKDDIQLIQLAFRDGRKWTNSDQQPWIINLKNSVEGKKINVSTRESSYIEKISWMPITTASSQEKKQIIKLLKGQQAVLDKHWHSYFIGKNILTNKSSQMVEYIDSRFISNDEKLTLNLDFTVEEEKYTNQVIKYLEQNPESRKLIVNKYYSKAEMGFMFGHTRNITNGHFGTWDKQDGIRVVSNIVGDIEGQDSGAAFKNEILSDDELVLSIGTVEYKDMKVVHHFIGNDKYNKNNKNGSTPNFLYLGEIKDFTIEDKIEKVILSNRKGIKKTREYSRMRFKLDNPIHKKDVSVIKTRQQILEK